MYIFLFSSQVFMNKIFWEVIWVIDKMVIHNHHSFKKWKTILKGMLTIINTWFSNFLAGTFYMYCIIIFSGAGILSIIALCILSKTKPSWTCNKLGLICSAAYLLGLSLHQYSTLPDIIGKIRSYSRRVYSLCLLGKK